MNSKIPGLYIHIPFCISKCCYCDFYSVPSISRISDFLEALLTEMRMYRGRFESFDTVYFGGGTPSILNPKQLEAILAGVRKNFNVLPNPEITLETNPADLDRAYLESVLDIGINRLHIGVQSLDPKLLGFLGRRHSVNQAREAIECSRRARFDNVGLDLIYGVPGQEMDSWLDTLRQALSFQPEHLSCYQLTVEPGTPLGRRYQEREFSLPDENVQHDFWMRTAETLEEAGYVHYEVSNFAREMNLVSRHNQKYWNHTPYLGLGPSAHSFLDDQRWWNERSLEGYLAAIASGQPSVQGGEILAREQLQLEALYLGLRTKKGFDFRHYAKQYGCDLLTEKGEMLNKLKEEGFASIEDGHLFPTRAGLALADSLALILSTPDSRSCLSSPLPAYEWVKR